MASRKVAIIGSGLIGRGWAMLFAGAGYSVSLYDVNRELVVSAIEDIGKQLKVLEETGMLRGNLSVVQQLQLINYAASMKECIESAFFLQECVPESMELKKEIFSEIDQLVDDENVIIASSTSSFPASTFSETMKHRDQVIVAHPVNPPFYVPLIELAPAPWTRSDITSKTRQIMEELGQKPVTILKEIPGFVLNRIQAAVLNESWSLVQQGVVSTNDMDTVMKDGLGPRYAFFGPLETAHLTAQGIENTLERYGGMFYGLSTTLSPALKLDDGPLVQTIVTELNSKVPLDKLQEERAWRNTCLAALAKLKRDLKKP